MVIHGGIIYILGMWLYAAFFGVELWPFLVGLTLVAGVSFVDDIHSLPDSVRLVVQFVAMGLIPDTPLWHWGYLVVVCGALAVGYVVFMKKYYHLHEEYLKSLEK